MYMQQDVLIQKIHYFYFYDILEQEKLISSDRKQVRGYTRPEDDGVELTKRDTRKLSGVVEMFCILFQVLVSWMYTIIKTHQT